MPRRILIIVSVLLLLGLLPSFLRSQTSQPSEKKAVAPSPYDFVAARQQWAYRHPTEPAVPKMNGSDWCKSPIDAFILADLEKKGLKPAPPAEKTTLIRRAYFDLIGLPPTPEEVDAFVADSSPEAFAKVVDHLLASPAYGQRWARHWLDVVRYTDAFDSRNVKGDTIGDTDVSQAWRYRDWVVKALNDDLPYDQFITKQIAGDLLEGEEFNPDDLIATGLYVIGNWGPGDADKEKMLTDIVDDQIDVTGRAFLGLTLSCARCHDHKYDPIPTADYYGLAGIFFSSHILPNPGQKTAGSLVAMVPLASPKELAKRKSHDDQIASTKLAIDTFFDDYFTERAKEMLPQVDRYLLAARAAEQQPPAGGANPDLAKLAAQQGLDRLILDRWVDYLRRQLHPQLQRTLLTTARHEVGGIKGLEGWTGAQDMPPNVVVNTTESAANYSTITLPPRCIAVHPGSKSGVAVEWRSPIAGVVSLNGQVSDGDSSCGNGIDWAIDLFPANGVSRLASGMFANGKQQRFEYGARADLGAIEVKPGDVIRVSVFPKGDYSCDTTVVELDIHDTRGNRNWSLTDDVLTNLHVGNPHPDRLGNSQVWSFGEVPDELPGNLPTATTPSRFAALFNASDDDAANIADGIRDTLVALDGQIEELRLAGRKVPTIKGSNGNIYKDLTSPRSPFWEEARKSDDNVASSARPKLEAIRHQLTELEQIKFPPIPTAHALQEGGTPQSAYEGTKDTKIQIRGRYDKLGDVVPRHLPRLLAGDDQSPITEGSGRLQLARWVASTDNPLTARVMMNRLWQHHFGQGIVRTPNNFGKLGVPPNHPELLDYLACQFMSRGWSIKGMHRAIMLSATYQQSSLGDKETMRVDPENLLIGRMSRQRLEAEPIRDALLFEAGNLDLAPAGQPTRDMNTHRRSLYLMSIRSERSDYRTLFDAPDPNTIGDGRINSTVAPQALFLLDNPFVLAQTKAVAARVLKEAPENDRAKIEWLYRHLYSRNPTAAEMEIGLSAMAQGSAQSDALTREAAWDAYCQVLICANEFVYVD